MKIYCKNIDRYLPVNGGETLSEILRDTPELADIARDMRPICARVNNKTEPLLFQVFGPKMVEFLPRTVGSGGRVYVRSLCMMLYRIVREVVPGSRLRIEHSISGGYFCRLWKGDGTPLQVDQPLIDTMLAKLRALQQRNAPFERDEVLTVDLIGMLRAQGLEDKALLLETVHDLYTTYYRLEGVIDSYYGALAPSTGLIDVFDLRLHKEGFILYGFDRRNPDVPARYVTQHKMDQAFSENLEFNKIIGVSNVGELNRAVDEGRTAQLIQVAEALHDKKISAIADEIARRYHRGGARVVLVAGPSSSGKTTTTKRLATYLITNLLKPKMISLDNYFVDRDRTPRDADGEYDFESLYALDLEQFNRDLTALLDGREVELPTYNFETGTREYRGDRMHLDPGDILLMEGIHGLNPALTPAIAENLKYRVYVSALTTLSIDDHNWIPTTDNRLLRRIIRDHKYRGASAVDTLRRWASVRRGEEKWIFPFQENADSTFNSSLIFELGVMRDYGEAILREVPNDCVEYAEAYRLRKFLSYFRPITDKSIPPTSLLREFLGGSSFRY
ncbi:MAG: nucleoside kinase [Muribaculaceae bacterium]|nr:nucleoside kinase [Muribaculaceae bacterium]